MNDKIRLREIRSWFAQVAPYHEDNGSLFHRDIGGPDALHSFAGACWCCPVWVNRTDFSTARQLADHVTALETIQ